MNRTSLLLLLSGLLVLLFAGVIFLTKSNEQQKTVETQASSEVRATALADSIKVMSYNFRYFAGHNKEKIATYLKDNNIDIVGFQELQYNPSDQTISQMSSALSAVNYPMTAVDTTYSPHPQHLPIFFNSNKYDQIGATQTMFIAEGGDPRKVITIRLRNKLTGTEYQVFNTHPGNVNSCDQSMNVLNTVKSINHPNSIILGDFNVHLNNEAEGNPCRDAFQNQFHISCRPGETTSRPKEECNGVLSNIDYILLNKTSSYRMVDSYMERTVFVNSGHQGPSDTRTPDSDHYPLVATLESSGGVPAATLEPLRVMSFNVLAGMNRQDDFGAFARYFFENDIDIVGMQEVDNIVSNRNVGAKSDDEYYQALLSEQQKLPATHPRKNTPIFVWQNDFQKILISRFPFEEKYGGEAGHPEVQSAVVSTPIGRYRLINIHPPASNTRLTCSTTERYFNENAVLNEPAQILIGDFNASYTRPEAHYVSSLDAYYRCSGGACNRNYNDPNCCENMTWCFNTFQNNYSFTKPPAKPPAQPYPIDFVMVSKQSGLVIEQSWHATELTYSDHYPVVAVIQNNGATPPPMSTPTSTTQPLTPAETWTPTPPPLPTATPTATPTPEPRFASCNKCGFCPDNPKQPGNLDACMACLYPDYPKDRYKETLEVDPVTNQPVQPRTGTYFSQLGCIDVGIAGFRDPAAAGGVVNIILNRLLFPITGVLGMLALIYGSFLLITGQDNPEQISRGKQWIFGAVIGLVFTFTAILLIRIIAGDILQIPGFNI